MTGATTAISIGVAVVGAAMTALSANNSAVAAQGQAKYQGQVARNNAILAQRAADRAKAQGDVAAQNKSLETRQLMARQTAGLAGNGLDVNSGTALDIIGDTAAIGNTDKQTILNNATAQANTYIGQANNFQGDASLYSAKASGINPAYDSFGTALNGLGSVADKWYTYSQGAPTKTTYYGGGKQ